MYNCHAILQRFPFFAGVAGKNRHFRDLPQQVLSGVVAGLNVDFLKFLIDFNFFSFYDLF